MTVQELMKTDVVTVSLTDSFGHAFDLMVARHVRTLPVVDAQGIYQGMFDLHDVWRVLLPRAAALDRASLRDLSYLAESREELRQRLERARSRPVREFLDDAKAPAIPHDASANEAILLLDRYGGHLAVIERQTRRFLGLVSPWEILSTLT